MKKNIKNLALLSILGVMISGCFANGNNSTTNNKPSSPKTSENSSSVKPSSSSTSTKDEDVSTSDSMLKVKEIEVVGTYKTEYYVGETLDLTGVQLLVTYTDDSNTTVAVTENMITPVDMTTVGMKTITVAYEDLTTQFYISVIEQQVEKVDPEVTISIENGATLTIGVDAAPTVTVPEGVNYVTYYEVDEVKVSDTLPTTPGTYSFIVETEENDQYNSARVWRWFRLVEPSTKATAEITFSYENGTTFIKGDSVKPEFTVSEGAEVETYYYSEERDLAGLTATFYSYEELIPGFAYSLNVNVLENDLFKESSAWRWFRLAEPSTKAAAEITFNYEGGTTYYIGGTERPTVTVSEGADYVITYESEAGYNSTEFPTEPGTYSLVVTVNENDLFKADKKWLWFRLAAPAVVEKINPEITFSYENGTTFIKGDSVKPEFTVSEGAEVEIYYYSEERDLAGLTATYYSYEELIPGFAYSLNVNVLENDIYNAGSGWKWFRLVEPSTKAAAEITFNYEGGTTYYVEGIERPTVTVSEGADYVITYESESGYNSEMFPTEPGTYSLVVTVNENDLFKASKQWLWFRLESSVNNGEVTA